MCTMFFRSLLKLRTLTGRPFIVNSSVISNRSVSTIFALSSGFGKCGVAVIRVSGPDAANVVMKFGGFKLLPEARKALLRRIRDPFTNEVLDQGLVLWFPGPRSFTGEDCCEMHVHGGTAVMSAILSSLERLPNLRLAEPGEFTKRSFYAGKLDLTAVEGLNDLINAETEFQRKQALLQMEGSLFHMYTEWKQILIKCVSEIEAFIDFSEDQDIDEGLLSNTREVAIQLRNKIKKHLDDGRRGERLRSGVHLAILGAPNVGKSSILNILCRRPAAIVSPLAGTTRDLIKVDLDLGGYPVVLTDTAGIHIDTIDQVEVEGVNRAKKAASDSDLILLVLDSAHLFEWLSTKFPIISSNFKKKFPILLSEYINNLQLKIDLPECDHLLNSSDAKDSQRRKFILIFNKTDLLQEFHLKLLKEMSNEFGMAVSCKTEDGIECLTKKLVSNVSALCGRPSIESPCYTQVRHRICLLECLKFLDSFVGYKGEQEIDLAGHYLRMALHSLGKVTGHVSTEQILDKIFADFCIGK